MNNKFLKYFLVIGSGTFISIVIGFLTTPIITRIVSPTEYGRFSIFTMHSNMALMALYLGLDRSLARFFYQKEADQYRKELLSKCLKNPVIGTAVSRIVVLILSAIGLIQFELGKAALPLVCFCTFTQIIYRFSLLLVRLQYKSKLYLILGIVQKTVYIVPTILLVKLNFFSGTMSLAVVTVLAALARMIISIVAKRRLWNPGLLGKNKCTITQGELIGYAYPHIFSMGVTTLFQYIDKTPLNYYCLYEEVGIYSSTMTLIHVFSIIQTAFNTLWVPMAVERYINDKEDVSFYQEGSQIIAVIMFFVGFTLTLYRDMSSVLLGAKYREVAYISSFLTFNPTMYTISETTVNGLVFKKKSNMQVVVSLGACIVNIIGNTILVPELGCQEAAISTGFSYIVFFTSRTILSNRYFHVDIYLKKFYFITALVTMYAPYNIFVKFNIGSIVGYIVCAVPLVLLYRATAKCGTQYVMDMATVSFRKKADK